MPTPIKPREWRMSQAEPAEADQTLQMFVGPIDDVKGMLENFESLCRMGKWHEALVGLQMANKWILDVERDMLEFLGVDQEETISDSDPSNPRFAQAGYDQFGKPTDDTGILTILREAGRRVSQALSETQKGNWGIAWDAAAEAKQALEGAEGLLRERAMGARQASNFRESDITLQERKDQEGDISYETLRRFAKW